MPQGTFYVQVNAGILWEQIIVDKQALFTDPAQQIIKTQQIVFSTKTAPIIADPVIKNIQIIENGEPLINVRHMQKLF